jgi:hypothetical protein
VSGVGCLVSTALKLINENGDDSFATVFLSLRSNSTSFFVVDENGEKTFLIR